MKTAARSIPARSARQSWREQESPDALANLDAWVPALGLGLRPLRAPDGTYRAVAEWRPSSSGKPLRSRSRNLSFDRRGIKDFGDGDKTYTALNVVLAAHELSSAQLDQAAVWLGERLGYDFSPKIVLTSKPKPAPEPVASPPAAAIEVEHRPAPAAPKPIPAPPVTAPEPIILPSLPAGNRMARLNELSTNVPGIVGDLMAWINGSTKTPVKPLALAASLTFLGTVSGRKYKGPTGLLTNLYTLGLADSGFGKDHARDCIKNLCAQAGLYAAARRLEDHLRFGHPDEA